MINCLSCGNHNLDTSRFCNECGTKLIAESQAVPVRPISEPSFSVPSVSNAGGAQVTSVGIPPLVEENNALVVPEPPKFEIQHTPVAKLIVERGDAANTEFELSATESNIGRWDADNGIFPDVDLDAFDPDAKISRRHARIINRDDSYFIEDLGSTNGTFVNRGRRLLPGSPQVLNEGDEIIVGKTFLRFTIS